MVDSEIKKYADSGNIKRLKYIFVDSLDVDPTFVSYEENYNYCKSNGLLEPHHDLTPFKESKSDWDEDYWALLKVDLIKNFSDERMSHMRAVAQVLLADKVKRIQAGRIADSCGQQQPRRSVEEVKIDSYKIRNQDSESAIVEPDCLSEEIAKQTCLPEETKNQGCEADPTPTAEIEALSSSRGQEVFENGGNVCDGSVDESDLRCAEEIKQDEERKKAIREQAAEYKAAIERENKRNEDIKKQREQWFSTQQERQRKNGNTPSKKAMGIVAVAAVAAVAVALLVLLRD